MGRRNYRRRNQNSIGSLVKDTVAIGNRLPWWGAATMGLILFVLFYWLFPAWLEHIFESSNNNSPLSSALHQIFQYRTHWLEYIGIVLGLIGGFFAIKNYYFAKPLSKQGEMGVGILSRILGRLFD